MTLKECTFIVVDKEDNDNDPHYLNSMCGDVNLFFNDDENENSAEIEIMIAKQDKRKKGLGLERWSKIKFSTIQ